MSQATPPKAKRVPHSHTHHGVTREDPWAWLRAENWQEVMQSPETLDNEIRAYLDAENTYYEDQFGKPTAELQDKIYKEIRGRIKEDDSGVPSPDGPWAYNSRMLEGKQYPQVVRTPRKGGTEAVLLDCNVEAGEDYFGFAGADHDMSHRYLAWAADRAGSEYYDIVVRDLETGVDSPEIIKDTAGSYVWSNDSSAIYYTEYDDNHRPYRVRRHDIGTEQSADPIIYEESDPGFFVGVGKTQNDKFIIIDAHDHQTSEVYLIDAEKGGEPRVVSPASPTANTTSRSATAFSISAPMPMAPRTTRSSPPRSTIPVPKTGPTSSPTAPACWCSIPLSSRTISCASNARMDCRASSFAT